MQLANFPTGADTVEPITLAHSFNWWMLHQGEDQLEETDVAGSEPMATSTDLLCESQEIL